MDWIDSYEATKFGEEWRDTRVVSEEFALRNWKTCPKSLDLVNESEKSEYLASALHLPHINGTLSLISQEQRNTRKPINVEVLLDTGASRSFISETCVENLGIRIGDTEWIRKKRTLLKSGFSNVFSPSEGTISVCISFESETRKNIEIQLECLIIKSPWNLIPGHDTIRKWRLVYLFPSLFGSDDEIVTRLEPGLEHNSSLE